ncbi:MAG: Tim44/TimA family putative adaptor protein [Hyphomicrobium sp.]
MNGQFDLLTLISLVVAVVVILKLRSVLGHRSEEDDARVERLKTREREATNATASAGTGEVINMPRRDRPDTAPAAEPASEDNETRIRAYPAMNQGVTDGLLTISRLDRAFDPEGFLTGAGRAYEMIVSAFAEGDRKQLKDLLSRDVYDGFVAAIGEREGRGEQIDQQFVGIKKREIIGAEVSGGTASITVRFVSELITAMRDRAGTVISGDPQRVTEVTDVWTFGRDVSSRRAIDNPNWKLDETQPPN